MIRRHAVCLALLLASSARALAQTPGGDDLDDPKLARRLKTRVSLPASDSAPAPDRPTAFAPVDALAATPSPAASLPSLVPAPSSSPSSSSAAPPASAAGAPEATISERPARSGERDDQTRTPLLQLGYRRFSFVQLGAAAPGSGNGTSASEPFNSLSIDFYPISRLVRFGMSTQYGWQSGTFDSGSGDYFIAQSFSLGLQHAGTTVTPFVEALAGAGYMRRFQFDRTVPTAYWQYGIDAGAAFFLARHAFVSAAIGYLRPINGFAEQQSFASIYLDTWSFKLGIGL